MRRTHLVAPLAIACLLAVGAGCSRKVTDSAGPAPNDTSSPVLTGPPESPPGPIVATTTKTNPPPAPSWPTPEDCVSYNPGNVTVTYQAGIHQVNDGGTIVVRVPGGPGDPEGDKALALAKRFSKHCFLGRNNNREEHNTFIFDYWRNPSGANPPIGDPEEDCSPYDRTNLTVEDMGDGNGWRVKDHDHVLHVFDNESDARNGKLVLAKYNQICFIGNDNDSDDPALVNYML